MCVRVACIAVTRCSCCCQLNVHCHSTSPPRLSQHTQTHKTAGQAANSSTRQEEEDAAAAAAAAAAGDRGATQQERQQRAAAAAGGGGGGGGDGSVTQQEQQQQQQTRRPRRAAADGAFAATVAEEDGGDEGAGRKPKRNKAQNTLPAEYDEASLSEQQRRFFRATNQQVRAHVFNSEML
jgi:hypothetical protein